MTTMTGKTEDQLAKDNKGMAIASIKSELAMLDFSINRPLEDLYASTGTRPFGAIQNIIDRKIQLRSDLSNLNG